MSLAASTASRMPKAVTGSAGLDDITKGGFPASRPTLVCGAAGCGKALLAVEFLVHGATQSLLGIRLAGWDAAALASLVSTSSPPGHCWCAGRN